MELLIIIGLVLLNGVFAMSELALVSSRKFKLESARKKGVTGAKKAIELSENPTKLLSTVQIGITLIGILLGIYSGDNLTSQIADFLRKFEFLVPYAETLSVGITVLFITYLSIVLGELFPKRVGMTFPETIAMMVAKPMDIISKITSPFVWLLTISNDILLKIFGIKKNTDSKVSEEEIKSIIKESAEGGEIQDIEHDIVERVFELGDRKADNLLTHRSELVYFNHDESWESVIAKIKAEQHSAYPVVENNNLDKIVGIVLLKDLFLSQNQGGFNISDYVKQPVYINQSVFVYKILEDFKLKKMHYGIVVDEYGSTVGMITMDDVMDALVGNMSEIHHFEHRIVQRADNSWLVDGQYPISDFLKDFDITYNEKDDRFNTVAGLFIDRYNSLPEIGAVIIIDGYEFEVVDKDGQRIDKILLTKI